MTGAIIPTNFWNLGYGWPWVYRKTCAYIALCHRFYLTVCLAAFFNFTHDIISIVPIFTGTSSFYTCSVDILKQLLGNETKTHLVKPLELTLPQLAHNTYRIASCLIISM